MKHIISGLFYVIIMSSVMAGCHPEHRTLLERREAIDLYGEALKLENEGDYQTALALLLKSLETSSPRPAVTYHIGHCYRMLDEKERAVEFLQLTLELAPDYHLAEMELKEIKTGFETASLPEQKTSPEPENPEPTTQIDESPAMQIASTPERTQDSTDATNTISQDETDDAQSKSPDQPGQVAQTTAPVKKNNIAQQKKDISNNQQQTPPSATTAATTIPDKDSAIPDETIRKILFPRLYGEEKTETDLDLSEYMKGRSLVDDPVEYHYAKGAYYAERKLWREAISEFKIALQNDERHLKSMQSLADVYLQSREPKKAEEMFDRALRMYPDNSELLFKYSHYLMDSKKYNEAITIIEKLKFVEPNNPKVYNNTGVSYLRLNNVNKAEEQFLTAIQKDPEFTNGYFNLGILYERYLKDNEKALQMYRMYVAKNGPQKEMVQQWIKDIETLEKNK